MQIRNSKLSTNKKPYRKADQIIAAVLQAASGGAVTKTKIMYGAALSYSQALQYIHELVCSGLLSENCERYTTTDNGFRWLQIHSELVQLVLQ